eukprot:TRINITY_DN23454_c0_g1_i1.p1 TRINITY_DN23454_c0_g1~~TRINITY_DN23454_c0_g1_i1.p1  ORF type:complete len:111 (+),score=29.55 TRINITY_DN23454_c0_g1_i1:63-395(+)
MCIRDSNKCTTYAPKDKISRRVKKYSEDNARKFEDSISAASRAQSNVSLKSESNKKIRGLERIYLQNVEILNQGNRLRKNVRKNETEYEEAESIASENKSMKSRYTQANK